MMLLAFGAIALSFVPNPGGESFEILLNNKLVIQRHGSNLNNVKDLQLDKNGVNDQLTIKYFHCGRVSKNRIVTIKDRQNNVVKVFRYADVANSVSAMTLPLKDILGLKTGNSSFNLFYTSSEVPNGRMLAKLILENY